MATSAGFHNTEGLRARPVPSHKSLFGGCHETYPYLSSHHFPKIENARVTAWHGFCGGETYGETNHLRSTLVTFAFRRIPSGPSPSCHLRLLLTVGGWPSGTYMVKRETHLVRHICVSNGPKPGVRTKCAPRAQR